jgi:acyl dehydratase
VRRRQCRCPRAERPRGHTGQGRGARCAGLLHSAQRVHINREEVALQIPQLYFEDFVPGQRIDTAGVTLSEGEIIDFALRFDPQPFHLDVEAAKGTIFGGLIASGFHTMALTFRLYVQTNALAAASLGSPGIDEVRWLRPVRPGDTLRATIEVLDSRPSTSKPDRGIVDVKYTTFNQRGEPVMTMLGKQLMRRRPAERTSAP